MLLRKEIVNESIYVLRASFEGQAYEKALDSKGQSPIAVYEEKYGDELYRKVFRENFISLYHETIREACLSNVRLEVIKIDYFSRERIVFTMALSRNREAKGNEDELREINTVLNKEYNRISNIDKLLIVPKEPRDEFFWKDLQEECLTFPPFLSQQLLPILSKTGVLNYNGGSVLVDIDDNSLGSFYPLTEISLFPCAVFVAALHEYIPDFSSEDERNLQKFIDVTAKNILDSTRELGGDINTVLSNRLNEYNLACKNEWLSGFSLCDESDVLFDELKSWTLNHQAKCAHLFCDHIAYIEHFRRLGTYEDLHKISPYVVKKSAQSHKNYMDLFRALYSSSSAIFEIVRGALNGGRKIRWRSDGLCQYCGREFEQGLSGLKCPSCNINKDY